MLARFFAPTKWSRVRNAIVTGIENDAALNGLLLAGTSGSVSAHVSGSVNTFDELIDINYTVVTSNE